MGLENSWENDGWKQTTKIVRFRNRILDNLTIEKVNFHHDADFSHSSLVNAAFIECSFNIHRNYSFDGCDLNNCTFMDLLGTLNRYQQDPLSNFFEMIKKKQITFSDVKNLDQARFDDERIKSAIKETFGL